MRARVNRQRLLLIVLSWVCSGCATFAHGSHESVDINSTPPGATIYVNGERQEPLTPATIDVRRQRSTTIRLERAGYEAREVRLKRRGSRWLWLNLGVCLNPLALQGIESTSQWSGVILSCFGVLTGIDLISSAAFAVQKDVRVDLTPAPP